MVKISSNKKAFTLTELLISMTIIGILAVISTQAIYHVNSQQYKNMYKKVYFQTKQIINEIINNEDYYTQNQTFADNIKITLNGEEIQGETALCNLIANKMKTIDEYNCESHPIFENGVATTDVNFTTVDNVSWILYTKPTNFNQGNGTILVDINGTKAPNRFEEDRFSIEVTKEGNTLPLKDIERQILDNEY